jgi:hypothetical protein
MKYSILSIHLIIFSLIAGCVGNGGQGSLFKPDSIIDTNGNFQGCVSGDSIDSSRVRVNFAWPSGASEMDIYRNGNLVATFTDELITNFIDVNLQEGGNYQYHCEAKINGIFKQGTNVLKLSPITVNPPIFSGIVSVVPKVNDLEGDSVTITWNPASNSGPLVGYYKIFAKPGCSLNDADLDSEEGIISPLGNFSVNIDNIGDEIPFSFAVRACTANNICDQNVSVKYLTPTCAPSSLNQGLVDTGAPKTVGVTAAKGLSGRRVQLTAPWDSSKGAVSNRHVEVSTTSPTSGFNPTKTEVVTNLGNPITNIILTSMDENTTYHFKVIDEDPSGNSNNSSAVVSLTTGDLTAPIFNGLTAATIGTPADTQINLTWVAIANQTLLNPEGAKDYLIYTNYVNFSPSGVDPANACESGSLTKTVPASDYASGESVNYAFLSLSRKTYSICVKAVDAAGNISSIGDPALVTTRDLTPPQFFGIQGLVYDATSGSISVTWNPSLSFDIKNYKVKLWKNSFTEPVGSDPLVLDPTTYSFGKFITRSDFPFLSNDIVYAYVNACDDAETIIGGTQNCTTYSTPLTLSLPDVDPPLDFAGISSAVSNANGAITVGWSNPPSLSDYYGFKVYSVNGPNNLTLLGNCACSVAQMMCPTTCSISNLNANRTYKLHVKAYDSVGNTTDYLNPVTQFENVTTLDTIAPQLTSTISYSDITASPARYDLFWSPATDNQYALEEPKAKIAYRLYRKADQEFSTNTPYNESDVFLVTTVTDEYPAQISKFTYSQFKSDLTDGKEYYYRVCAQDSTGVSAAGNSNITCMTTSTFINTPDITKPKALNLAHTKTSKRHKKWAITFNMNDNFTPNDNLKIKVYRKSNNNIFDLATTGDLLLSATAAPSTPSHYTLSKGATIADTTTISNLTGPRDASSYLHYLVQVEDSQGNVADNYVSVFSDNIVTISSIVNNEIVKGGKQWILIRGTGFSSESDNALGVSSRVDLGGVGCSNELDGTIIVNSTKILCKTPIFTSIGKISINVINPDGSKASFANAIEVFDNASETATFCDNNLPWPRCVDGLIGGSCLGTANQPYLICQESDLNSAKASPTNFFFNSSKHFVLGNHIDFSASSNKSDFGDIRPGIQDFTIPKIDGKNHFLIKKKITGGTDSGLFSYAFGSSTRPDYSLYIKDLGVYGLVIDGFVNTASRVGGLVGWVSSTSLKFENITMVVDIQSDNYPLNDVGGLVGYNISQLGDNKVINSWVKMNAAYRSTSSATIGLSIGGIAGNATVNIINSHTEGSIKDLGGRGYYAGGLVGTNRRSNLPCDISIGETHGTCGIVGSSSSMVISNFRYYSGGLIGTYDTSSSTAQNAGIHQSYFDGRLEYSVIVPHGYYGGLVGNWESRNGGSIEITKSFASPSFDNQLVKGFSTPVTTTSSFFGGLVGQFNINTGSTANALIKESYSSGIITAEDRSTGGLVGHVGGINLAVRDSYSENIIQNSSVSSEYMGGFVGSLSSAGTLSIDTSYFAGNMLVGAAIIPGSSVGPLIGRVEATSIYNQTDNYFDKNVCPAAVCLIDSSSEARINGGQGLETSKMKDPTNYLANFMDFDFTTVWMPPTANPSSYPKLRNSPPSDF